VRYGVDFSEIFSYVSHTDTYATMKLFDDDDSRTSRGIETAAMSALFEEKRDKLVLLAPYALELQSHVEQLQSRSVAEVARDIALAKAGLTALRDQIPGRLRGLASWSLRSSRRMRSPFSRTKARDRPVAQ
jgi:hypothetical protein